MGSTMKVRDVIKLVEAEGWFYVSITGSPRQYEHPTRKGRVNISGNLNDDVRPATLKSIRQQAGIGGSFSDAQRSRNRRKRGE